MDILGTHILISSSEKTSGGIILTSKSAELKDVARVEGVGEGVIEYVFLEKGSHLVYNRFAGHAASRTVREMYGIDDDRSCKWIDVTDVIATFTKEEESKLTTEV